MRGGDPEEQSDERFALPPPARLSPPGYNFGHPVQALPPYKCLHNVRINAVNDDRFIDQPGHNAAFSEGKRAYYIRTCVLIVKGIVAHCSGQYGVK